MLIKIHNSYREIIAICDSDLLNKKFQEGKRVLNVKEGFFGGEEVSQEKAVKMMEYYQKEDATFNIIGKESVESAIKAGIISKEGIMKVENIPFALVLM